MSKFYTYDELQKGIPTKDTVSQVRDTLLDYIRKKSEPGSLVIYGSTIWSFNGHFSEQHTARSDIDIAVNANIHGKERGNEENFERICKNISFETNVPIQLTKIGEVKNYQGLINPSTVDHFRLLAKRFPNEGYKNFKVVLEVKFKDRRVDLDNYINQIKGLADNLRYSDNSRRPTDWRDSNNLSGLSTLENFPDHLIRKALGKEKALPCPDSKTNVREVFRNFSRPWRIRNELQPYFDEIIESSADYETLIAGRKNLTQMSYEEKLSGIATDISKITDKILNKIPWTGIRDFL